MTSACCAGEGRQRTEDGGRLMSKRDVRRYGSFFGFENGGIAETFFVVGVNFSRSGLLGEKKWAVLNRSLTRRLAKCSAY